MTYSAPDRRSLILSAAALLAAPAIARAQAPTKLRVGVTAGPHAQILEAVKPVAAKRGLDLSITEFSDYILPNAALASGDLDVNSYQHKPFLDQQNADRKYNLVGVGFTVNFPIGVYSKKHKRWEEVPAGAQIAIPNDPTNGGRALLLFQDKGLVKLKEGVGYRPTIADIVQNERRFRFIELEAAQTARSLDDVAAAVINTNYALSAGLTPGRDALLREDPKGPYVNLIAVRDADKDKAWVKPFVESYQSAEVREFVQKTFQGSVLSSW
ncbi:MAG: MetQ/NlpA family ABC transporter substrate-binding protein [Phreatobacter sp.]|uniref:MetQ/NlpA family ABC transporter substrate-binding protein n=1 Tax=Phreatobacter sp. TaxID=1966341 RepID=UPI001A55BF25|nr:MetQ/NlpA family ABC transporter substrate-binding protein [Phreatobacter sp.]MBL8569817.1 MetQ/NlpA family ABC transporter substrate-binding protein [Phreatobacter sp.]